MSDRLYLSLEQHVIKDQQAKGRWAAQTGSPAVDVVSLESCHDPKCVLNVPHARLIRVRADGYLPPAERVALLEAAKLAAATALMAWSEGGEIKYEEVT